MSDIDWKIENLKGTKRGEPTKRRLWRQAEIQGDGSVLIPLANGMNAIVDEEDAPKVFRRHWYAFSLDGGRTFYAARKGKAHERSCVLMHRVVLEVSGNEIIDHKNCNGLDNRRSNLRICSNTENSRNSRRSLSNKSGIKGVYFHIGIKRWIARIRTGGRQISLGCFRNPEQAGAAYAAASRQYHGEFGRIK